MVGEIIPESRATSLGIRTPVHGDANPDVLQRRREREAGELGKFNRSSQHLNHGGVYGTTRWVDAEVDGARRNALARCAVASV